LPLSKPSAKIGTAPGSTKSPALHIMTRHGQGGEPGQIPGVPHEHLPLAVDGGDFEFAVAIQIAQHRCGGDSVIVNIQRRSRFNQPMVIEDPRPCRSHIAVVDIKVRKSTSVSAIAIDIANHRLAGILHCLA
jgi:hypothetical protein